MSFDFGISLISASLTAVKSINDGSFFLPLFGTGAKKGLSVSINTFSKGKDLKAVSYTHLTLPTILLV